MLFSAEELTQSNYNYTGPPLTSKNSIIRLETNHVYYLNS